MLQYDRQIPEVGKTACGKMYTQVFKVPASPVSGKMASDTLLGLPTPACGIPEHLQ